MPSSQQSCVPSVAEVRPDSSRLTPISDGSRDGTHACQLVETRGPSKLDARIHAVHWFHAMESLVSSRTQRRSDFGSLSRSASALRAPPCLENPREDRSDKPPHSCTARFCTSADRQPLPAKTVSQSCAKLTEAASGNATVTASACITSRMFAAIARRTSRRSRIFPKTALVNRSRNSLNRDMPPEELNLFELIPRSMA